MRAFGAGVIFLAVLLSVAVIATPAAVGSLLFGGLLVAVGFAAYTLRRR